MRKTARRYTNTEAKQIVELYRSGKTAGQIAEKVSGRTVLSVRSWLSRNLVTKRRPSNRVFQVSSTAKVFGAKAHKATQSWVHFSEALGKQVTELYFDGKTSRQIASIVNRSVPAVQGWLSRNRVTRRGYSTRTRNLAKTTPKPANRALTSSKNTQESLESLLKRHAALTTERESVAKQIRTRLAPYSSLLRQATVTK